MLQYVVTHNFSAEENTAREESPISLQLMGNGQNEEKLDKHDELRESRLILIGYDKSQRQKPVASPRLAIDLNDKPIRVTPSKIGMKPISIISSSEFTADVQQSEQYPSPEMHPLSGENLQRKRQNHLQMLHQQRQRRLAAQTSLYRDDSSEFQ